MKPRQLSIINRNDGYPEAFESFWKAYPRRTKKIDALKAWQELELSERDLPMLLDALAWQVNQPQWLRDGGQFVPYPSTWLRARQFEDEPFNPPAVQEARTKADRTVLAARSLAAKLGAQ